MFPNRITLVNTSMLPCPNKDQSSPSILCEEMGFPARMSTCRRIPLNPLLASESHEKYPRLRSTPGCGAKRSEPTIWSNRSSLPISMHSSSCTRTVSRHTYMLQSMCPRPVDKGIINQPSIPTNWKWLALPASAREHAYTDVVVVVHYSGCICTLLRNCWRLLVPVDYPTILLKS